MIAHPRCLLHPCKNAAIAKKSTIYIDYMVEDYKRKLVLICFFFLLLIFKDLLQDL